VAPVLTYDDAKAIEKSVDGCFMWRPWFPRGYQVVVGNQNWTTNVQGTTPNILDIRDYQMDEGRNFNERDITSRDRVCVIGKTIVDNLFPEGNPVGRPCVLARRLLRLSAF
jgi:putative ABC transport system permease protein